MSVSVEMESHKDEVLEEMESGVRRALYAIGMQASDNVAELCPVDTGLLKNSITFALAGEAPAIGEYEADRAKRNGNKEKRLYKGTASGSTEDHAVFVGTNLEYAAYVEYGTSLHNDPKHFLQRGIMDNIEQYKQIAKEQME